MTTLRYLEQATDAGAGLPIGYDCTDQQGEQLGQVAGVIVDSTQRSQYLVLKTGGWFSHKQYVVPNDQLTERNDTARRLVFAGLTREALGDGRFAEYDASWLGSHDQAADAEMPATAASGEQQLELREERLRVDAEPYQAGTVRLSRHLVERQETVQVTLREEYLRLEFSATDGSVRVGEHELGAGETLDIPILKERAVVHTEVALREGVTLRKEALERTEQVQGSVRREELTVEQGAEFVAGSAAEAATPTDYLPAGAPPLDQTKRAATSPADTTTRQPR